MRLEEVLHGVQHKAASDISGIGVTMIVCDSRAVMPGDLFVAMRGYSINGSKFIDDAITNGAKIVLAEEDFKAPPGVVKILISDSRTALPIIADNFYDHPSRRLKVIGVTGTNGKTTITYLIENILKACGEEAGVIGTVNYRMKDRSMPAKNTTPGPLELASMFAAAVNDGLAYMVMEVSSHALDQHRVDGIHFDAAIFTNITNEHLDYHKTFDNYFRAKARLFDRLKLSGAAVLNMDDKTLASLKDSMNVNTVTYSTADGADVTAEEIDLTLEGSRFTVKTPRGRFRVNTRLIGIHNVSNILASVGAAFALNLNQDAALEGIESTAVVPGRLETVESGQPFKVFIDYAHTEDALYNALAILRKAAGRNIITVFGCGGDRDKEKRPLMGKTACENSDVVIITSDNPRFEEPRSIIGEIEEGIRGRFSNYEIEVERALAIEKALSIARQGDIVLIAGKGHEAYQIIRDKMMPFDDREVVREVLMKGLRVVGS